MTHDPQQPGSDDPLSDGHADERPSFTSDSNGGNGDQNEYDDDTPSCLPFDPNRLRQEFAWDSMIRWLLFATVVALVVLSLASSEHLYGPDLIPPTITPPLTIAVVIGWIWMGTSSRRAADRLVRATSVLEQDASTAETFLAEGMRRRPVGRSIRLLLYHRLAVLRHRQGDFEEAGLISQTLLNLHLRGVEHIRTHLLLLLAESQLRCNHPDKANDAMNALNGRELQLVESLQLLALRTQYDVSQGHHAEALNNLDEKIKLSEIMPGAQCGALHSMLATSAKKLQRHDLADWLNRRAKLLCAEKQLNELTLPLAETMASPL